MDIFNEIIEYLGTKDARLTIYGAILGMIVVFLVRRLFIVMSAWSSNAKKTGQKGFRQFCSWHGHHYKDCPGWLKALARVLEKCFYTLSGKKKRRNNGRYNRRNSNRL